MKRKDKLGDEWQPKWKTRMEKEQKHKLKKMQERKLKHPSDLSNNQRMHVRTQARKEAAAIVKEATL